MTFKNHLYLIFERPTSHNFGVIVQVLIFLNIFVSIIVMFLVTEKSLEIYNHIFYTINTVNAILFTIEYILRIYAINFNNPTRSRIKYAFTPFMVIDFLVILPFYLTFFQMDLGFLRALRIIRIFKLFRVVKFAEFDNLLFGIIKEKKEEFIFIFVLLLVIILTLTPIVYYFENQAQPEVFTSMLTTLWWAVITFTTVGYGDMYPITVIGRVLTSVVCFLGIALYAIPGSIFTSALLHKMNERKKNCEH